MVDACPEVRPAAWLDRSGGRSPLLIVGAPQQLRELRAEVDRFVERQSVAYGMKYRLEQSVGSAFVIPAKTFVQLIDPKMRELEGMIEAFQTRGAHGLLLRQLRNKL